MNFLRHLSRMGRAEWERAEDQRVFSRRHFLMSGAVAVAAMAGLPESPPQAHLFLWVNRPRWAWIGTGRVTEGQAGGPIRHYEAGRSARIVTGDQLAWDFAKKQLLVNGAVVETREVVGS